jgi:exopolysaccharide biosynthesis polyprenyl glycosylphosphotransferase
MVNLHGQSVHDTRYASYSKPKIADKRRFGQGLILPALDLSAMLAVPAYQVIVSGEAGLRVIRVITLWLLVTCGTMIFIALQNGYRRQLKTTKGLKISSVLYVYLITSIIVLIVVGLLQSDYGLTRNWSVTELLLAPLLLILVRTKTLDRFIQHAAPVYRGGTVVVCYDQCPAALLNALTAQRGEANVKGILYLAPHTLQQADQPWPVIKDALDLADWVKMQMPDEVVFVDQPASANICTEIHSAVLEILLAYPIRFCLAVDIESRFKHSLVTRARTYKFVPFDMLIDATNPLKRAFDILGASLLLVIFSLLLMLIALLVRADGHGPAIFRQIRIGAHGQPFTIFKFRTMNAASGADFVQAKLNDPRVTKIGRFLRRSSLDELLQLFNVLKGDMSLVGPRPHAAETRAAGLVMENAVKFYGVRHRVKPGITGLAQIRGHRGSTQQLEALEQRIASDLEYIQNWSIWLDLIIIFKTLPVFFTQRNAY